MTAPAPKKFNFDLDMGASRVHQRVIAQTELDRLVAEAEEKGYRRGLSDGEQTAMAQSQRQLAQSVETLVSNSSRAVEAAESRHAELMRDAISLAVTAAGKFAAFTLMRFPLDSVRQLLSECLASLDNAPHLVIRCHPDMADAVKKLAENRIRTSGFEGRLAVLGEPELGIGDARFEWRDGGLKHELGDISAQINEKIKTFLASQEATETVK